MTATSARDYNCKDEELPVICKFAAFSLKRDLADFTDYSPKLNQQYVTGYEAKIATVSELVEPKSETVALKAITDRLYNTMDGLIDPINQLTGYIGLAEDAINISPADFGLADLRKGIIPKDAERVISSLHTINANIAKYNEVLTLQGFRVELGAKFAASALSVATDKQKQYEITSNRKKLVQDNLSLLNDLFKQLNEILKVGKILYKAKDAAKLKDYTFSELKKGVRKTAKTTSTPTNGENKVANTPKIKE
jgi:hypothetical protein